VVTYFKKSRVLQVYFQDFCLHFHVVSEHRKYNCRIDVHRGALPASTLAPVRLGNCREMLVAPSRIIPISKSGIKTVVTDQMIGYGCFCVPIEILPACRDPPVI